MESCFSDIILKMDYMSFGKLPRIPGYKSEYVGGVATLIPRPKFVQLNFDLMNRVRPEWDSTIADNILIRKLVEGDWEGLVSPMMSAFSYIQPFKSMDKDTAAKNIGDCLEKTKTGQDGELVPDACYVVCENGDIKGAVIITIFNDKPHLTWLFVELFSQHDGLGSCLFRETVETLRERYSILHSTVMANNVGALLWHWKQGFKISEVLGKV